MSVCLFWIHLGSRRESTKKTDFVLHNPGETNGIKWMSFKEGNFNSHCASFCASQSVFQSTLNKPDSDNDKPYNNQEVSSVFQ